LHVGNKNLWIAQIFECLLKNYTKKTQLNVGTVSDDDRSTGRTPLPDTGKNIYISE
jgi:hypothetical protein